MSLQELTIAQGPALRPRNSSPSLHVREHRVLSPSRQPGLHVLVLQLPHATCVALTSHLAVIQTGLTLCC